MIIMLLMIFLVSFPLTIIIGKKTGRIIPLCFFLLTVIEYLDLEFSFVFDFLLLFSLTTCLLWLVAIILIRSGKRSFQKSLSFFLCPSLLLFVLFYVYLFFVTHNRGLNSIDDFTIWGWRVKETLRTSTLYSDTSYFVKDFNLHLRPFSTVFLVLFNRFFGTYKESTSLFAHDIFCISMLLIFYDRFDWKTKDLLGLISSPILMVFLLLTVGNNGFNDANCFVFNTAYPDWITSVLLANGFLQLIDNKLESGDYLLFGTTVTMLLLADRIDFAFALLLSSTMIAYTLVQSSDHSSRRLPVAFAYVVVMPVVVYSFWRIHVYSINSDAWRHFFIYDPNNGIQTILNPIRSSMQASLKSHSLETTNFSPLNDTQEYILSYFFKTLISEPLISHPFQLTYFTLVFLTALSLFVTCVFNRRRIDVHVIALFYFLGAVAYAFAIGLSYSLLFSEYEGIRLAQFGRYMQNYTLFGMIIAFLVPLSVIRDGRWCILGLFLSFLFIEPSSINTAIYQKNPYIYLEKEKEVVQEYIDTAYEGENILIVVQGEQKDYYILRYLFGKYWNRVTRFYSYRPGEDINRFLSNLKRNQYVLLANTNDEFINELWSKVCDDYPCMNMTLYKITVGGDGRVYFEMGYNFEYMVENGLSFAEYLESY